MLRSQHQTIWPNTRPSDPTFYSYNTRPSGPTPDHLAQHQTIWPNTRPSGPTPDHLAQHHNTRPSGPTSQHQTIWPNILLQATKSQCSDRQERRPRVEGFHFASQIYRILSETKPHQPAE
ncbi:hypothetical protein ACOMHN_037516 [Nucella lapillus]